MKWLLISLLRAYRFAISPLYGQVCRYYPSCSQYALDAVEHCGSVKGSWLAVRRIGRCHPWAAGGVDHVPGTPQAEAYERNQRSAGAQRDDLEESVQWVS